MITEEKLLEHYMWGFTDELDSKPSPVFDDDLITKAYQLGRDNAIIGDDVRSIDYLSNQEILRMINNYGTTKN
jgi:hypothetical protein